MTVILPKVQWTYDDYAAILPDGKRHEIVAGEHYVNPAPNLYHQTISRRLQFLLYVAIEKSGLGVVIDAPVDVQLTDHDIVQPDLVIIGNGRSHIMTPTKVVGVPDWIVEILSPSNAAYDLTTKRKVYERCGVPEYWIVFPDEHQILQLTLMDGRYRESYVSDRITIPVHPHIEIDLREVW